MKLFLRILLFISCITITHFSRSFAIESPTPAVTATTDFETLEKNYVQLELSTDNSVNISIIKSLNSIIKLIQVKYYSLLNWRTIARHGSLEITNYSRILNFGTWINDPNDETCYNTRALVLLRDSDKAVVFKENNHCSVDSGHWNDPYTGEVFTETKDIQIDHVVPLKNAYMSGAYRWDFKTRCHYANYLGLDYHLLSVNGSQNMKKGDRAPDKYMPPNSAYTCTYLKNWLSIKFLWGLKMTESEAVAISTAIKDNNCNTRSFRMSDREILSQARFFQDTVDLCEKLIASQPLTN